MPPRALIEPETGRSLSRLRKSRPSNLSVILTRRSFMRGISVSSDSMMPPDLAVSGKAAAIYGAKRCNLASASSMSAIVNGSLAG